MAAALLGCGPRTSGPSAAVSGSVGATAATDPDPDGDGLRGEADFCPDLAEDRDGCWDLDGCPDEDDDGDGVADALDACPGVREIPDGIDDADGCPEGDILIRNTGIDHFTFEKVYFAPGSSVLPYGSVEFLDVLAHHLVTPTILVMGVRGGCDEVECPPGVAGSGAVPALARARIEAVREHLIARGIDPRRVPFTGGLLYDPASLPGLVSESADEISARRRVVEFEPVLIQDCDRRGVSGK